MQELTYVNVIGEKATFGGGPPYILEHVKGLGRPDVTFRTSRGAFQQGDTLWRVDLNPRFVEFSFHIQGKSRADMYEKREALAGLLSVSRTYSGGTQGKLTYRNDHGAWWIYAVPDGPDPETRFNDWMVQCKMAFRCANPYWTSEQEGILSLLMGEKDLVLPFISPFVLGIRKFLGDAINPGHIDAPLKIEISGAADTPTLINHTTGAQLKVVRKIPTEHKLAIDTDPGRLSVKLRAPDGAEEPAFHYLSLDSSIARFTLRPGSNQIELCPSYPRASSRAELKWNAIFEGV
jgi:hypothetical protein